MKRYSNRAVIVIYSNRAFSIDYSLLGLNHFHCLKLLFKSSNESTAWHCIELIDRAYHALAVSYNQEITSTCHFKAYNLFSNFS